MRSTCNYLGVVVCLSAFTACAPPAPASAAATFPPPYSREAFGDGWASTSRGCDVRDQVLKRDITNVTNADRCGPLAGTLNDPYSAAIVVGPTRQLDVDHRLSAAEAWRLGAWRWTKAQRVRFYNDPANLVTTTAKANRSKGDKSLSQWTPAVDRCGFARAVDAVADRYALADPARDGVVAAVCR